MSITIYNQFQSRIIVLKRLILISLQTSNIALVTFIYPSVRKFLPSFVDYLNQQSTQEYHLLIFNDGIETPDQWFEALRKPFRIITTKSTSPLDIRFEALNYLKETVFDKFIFQDSDDGLSANRVEVVSKWLDNYDLVVNDIDLMDFEGNLTSQKIWGNRFKLKSEFKAEDILNHNFVGLGNTGITKILLEFIPDNPTENLIAVDWFLFFNMLRASKKTGFRTSECTTYYRQHIENTIGVSENTKLYNIKAARKLHFSALNKVGAFTDITQYEENIIVPAIKNHQYPYWWEIKKNYSI